MVFSGKVFEAGEDCVMEVREVGCLGCAHLSLV